MHLLGVTAHPVPPEVHAAYALFAHFPLVFVAEDT